MFALTIAQPTLEQLIEGEIRSINRFRRLYCLNQTEPFIGPVFLHAAKTQERFHSEHANKYPLAEFGCVVAEAVIVGCFNVSSIESGNIPAELNWLTDITHRGPFVLVFDHVTRLTNPIRTAGSLGLWEFDPNQTAAPLNLS
jgi:hypothetical protein